MVMYKKGQNSAAIWIIVGVLVLLSLPYLKNALGGGSGGGLTPVGDQTIGTSTPELCPDSSSTMTVGPAKVWRAPTTDLANEYHRVYVGGIDQGLIRDSQTLSVRVRDGTGVSNEIVIYYAENSTERYAADAKFTPPCGAFTSAAYSKNRHIVANSTQALTFNSFNSNNGDLNTITNNITITTGEGVHFTLDWFGETDRAVSPYGQAVVIVDYNDSEFDGALFSIGSNPRVSVPTYHTPVNFATNFKSLAWNVPGGPDPSALVDKSGRWTLKDTLNVKADATVNPTGNNAQSSFNVTVCSQNWYQDPDSPTEKFGTEDSRGVRQGFECESAELFYQ